jgi:hypothetical protein
MKQFAIALFIFTFALNCWSAVSASVGVIWDKAENHTEETTFRVSVGLAPGEYYRFVEAGTNTQVVIDDLEPGSTYFFMCQAFDRGLYSDPSNEIAYTVPTGDPVELVQYFTIVRGPESGLLRWNPNPVGQLVFQYEVQYRMASDTDFVSLMVTGTEATIPTDRLSTYVVRVRAIGAAGAGPWLERTVPGLVPPSSVLISRNGSVQYQWKP